MPYECDLQVFLESCSVEWTSATDVLNMHIIFHPEDASGSRLDWIEYD